MFCTKFKGKLQEKYLLRIFLLMSLLGHRIQGIKTCRNESNGT